MQKFLIALTRNPVSLFGVAVATAAASLIILLFGLELTGLHGNPYLGILAYLVLPAMFVFGLILIPLGIIRERRRAHRAEQEGQPPPRFPIIDLNLDHTRKIVIVFLIFTLVNLVILTTATYKAVEVMDSTEFCGATCHSVMSPEYTAYGGSPHSRVNCVECHIGPGAGWFVKSKLSGAWQVVSVMFDLYQRPIPTPIHNLRPARETCEQCHWPNKFVGDQLRVETRYSNDETSTETKTVLLLRIGGVQGRTSHGIHWHVDPGIEIRYRSDEKRERIYQVQLRDKDGTEKTFVQPDLAAEVREESGSEAGPWRLMDCVDCHNRPTHTFGLPDQEIDRALREGRLDRSLPFVRREAVKALSEEYASLEEAREGIGAALISFYEADYPEVARERGPAIQEASQILGAIYGRNVFPQMNVTWGTYPNHIGHLNFPGCFRCHDDEHVTEEGEAISQDCSTCHTLLAMEEEEPEVLQMLQP